MKTKQVKILKGFLAIFVCCLLMPAVVKAQKLNNQIDSLIMAAMPDLQGPGGAFMVAQKGKVIYQKAFGRANLELGVNLTTESIFQLGSMTKQFTAVAVLLLEQQGKLKVSDYLSKYIPDYPGGDKITIHHLLTHTSGIKDFTKMKTLAGIAQKEMTPKMMVDFFKNEPVDFAPGERFDYNNSGYVLLGYLIEQVSGEAYADFIRQHIFAPLGMDHSYYASDRQVIYNRAYGYQKKENGYVNKTAISFSVPFASGALMSTLGDLLKWQNALSQNNLLNAAETTKAFSRYKLNNGEPVNYGYGWHIKELGGLTVRAHGGSIFGFKSMGVYVPGEDIYVVALTNCDCNSPTLPAENIAKLVINATVKGK
ncbi:serine hydrolase domain-containing protein [Pedobacter zeae]|uniref:CubicO group peptidase (Beta-lactamase class C family) n=2 Tax=Pedobacter zeae TaxID=1737356 RepID=A0A7W6KCT7_9SPHI|nr:serine hydrolase domain-containing protein [Pedobacter zeae]MBB4109436.1 CubicO group peptidase (beta-lactamase class C family) [Pedobacter zeae]